MTWYILASTVLLAILGIVWRNRDTFNLLVKATLILMSVWGIIEYGIATGYILKLR